MEGGAAARETKDRMVRLVLADDSRPARDAIEAIVDRSPGFEVVAAAATGEEAIELVARLRPDLAVLDIRMPGIGGIEAARSITGNWPETVVILVSALEDDDLPSAVDACGVTAVINKSAFTAGSLAAVWTRRGESVVHRTGIRVGPHEGSPPVSERRQGRGHGGTSSADGGRTNGG